MQSLQLLFTDFLRTFKDSKGNFKYRDRIREMIIKERKSLLIDYEDLINYDPQLIDVIEENPDIALQAFSESIKELVRQENPDYAQKVYKFYPRLNGWIKTTPIRGIRSDHINKLVLIEGIIVRATPPRQKLFKAVYLHTLPSGEQHEFEWPPNPNEELGDELEKPTYCPICITSLEEEGVSKGRLARGSFKLLIEKSKYRDWQLIVVQERPEEVPAGQIPRSVEVVLTDDIVDVARPGDRVSVVGIVRLSKGSKRSTKPVFSVFIEANNLIVAQRFLEELKLSPEDEEKIRELSKDPLIRRKIIASIAPTIYGMWDIKEAVALLLFGGVPKIAPDGTKIRGDIHVLLLGDPGTAKSQILQYTARIAPRGIYTTGKGSSAAGLTATVIKDKQTGEYFLEAGAMVLADGGIVCIDEIDKMRDEDRVAIHEAMEQGTVSIAKAGIVARLNARASVLAAGNPKHGRYIPNLGLTGNINLPVTILSRFDLIFILKDIAQIERDRSLVRYVLETHETLANVEPEIPPDLLRKYIAYARKYVKPRITKEAQRLIEEYYIELRKKSAENPEAPLAITTRQLEALIRLAEAHARMKLKNKVEAEDAAEAIRLMNSMLEMVGLDIETGDIDIDTIMTGKPKSMREKEITILNIIKEAVASDESSRACIKLSRLRGEAEKLGIDEHTLERIIRNLKKMGDIYERRPGCFAPVD
ncbi:MAG: Minichromosome maintenance protein MCM [Thermoprotei archaeon]|nr:MAG: Minichromosome maintenance protein MCM [Thermoprotei archaeon]